jgi:hypothetical protein
MTLSALGIFSAAGVSGAPVGAYELIESVILGSTATSVTFSGLGAYSSTYRHLQIRAVNRQTGSNQIIGTGIRFNADSGNNYAIHRLFTNNGSTPQSQNFTTQNTMFYSGVPAALQTANAFGGAIIDILDFSSTTKNKTIRVQSGVYATQGEVYLSSAFWNSTNAITSITLTADSTAHAIGSRFSLYGIRG